MSTKIIAFPATQNATLIYGSKPAPIWERACKALKPIRFFHRSLLTICLALNLTCIGVSVFIFFNTLFA